MISPSCSTRIEVARTTVESLCAMITVVLPDIKPSRASCTSCSFVPSNALVASSKSNTFGSRTTARAMATRCFCPPDMRHARSPGWLP
mmetsp:Transcript_70880/g.207690  ORF Transcript_70880/g.207690 Transcript_70880/m.207690 type:complete len:88 (+) Transcript_70880:268-531(+)